MRTLVLAAALLVLGGCGSDKGAPPDPSASQSITVTSPEFDDGATIPTEYTCKGAGDAPRIRWSGSFRDVGSFAVVVDDPDAPGGDYVHWIVIGIRPGGGDLDADSLPSGAREIDGSGGSGWKPPCPPSGTHHYRFTVYAIPEGQTSSLEGDPSPGQAVEWIADQAVAWGRLTGTVSAD